MMPAYGSSDGGNMMRLNTSVAAVAYRKNSYHSTTVPAMDAVTTRRRLDSLYVPSGAGLKPCAVTSS
jgi:hypothetical protein